MNIPSLPFPASQGWGFCSSNSVAAAPLDYSLTSTTTYKCAFGQSLLEADLPDVVMVYGVGLSGTFDLQCELWSHDSVNSRPNAKISNTNTVTLTNPSGSGKLTFSGLKGSGSGAIGDVVWAVIRVPSGTPTAGVLRTTIANCSPMAVSGFYRRASYTTYWSSTSFGCIGAQFQYTSGLVVGNTVQNFTSDTSIKIYGTYELGDNFVSPNAHIKVVGAICVYIRNNNPADYEMPIRVNGALIGTATHTTGAYDHGVFPSIALPAFLPAPVIIPPNSNVTLTLRQQGGGGSSSNYYNLCPLTVDADQSNYDNRPCNGTLRQAYFDGASWTYTDNILYQIWLIFDFANAIQTPPLNRRKMTNMR